MAHRTCLITGANTGLGYEVARQLLSAGHSVILACRDSSKAAAAVARLQQQQPQQPRPTNGAAPAPRVSAVTCDLASLDSVRSCAHQLLQQLPRLDVLVCNAAVITANVPTMTADGFDTMYQVNHLGHFLLSQLLLPLLGKAAHPPGRIVVVGSKMEAKTPEWLQQPAAIHGLATQQQHQQQAPTPLQWYSATKLCNIWFTRQMAASLAAAPSSGSSSSAHIVVNAVTPGFIPSTSLGRNLGNPLTRLAMTHLMPWAPFAVTSQQGASRVVSLCLGDGSSDGDTPGISSSSSGGGIGNGGYYVNHHLAAASTAAEDDARAAELWRLSCKDVGL